MDSEKVNNYEHREQENKKEQELCFSRQLICLFFIIFFPTFLTFNCLTYFAFQTTDDDSITMAHYMITNAHRSPPKWIWVDDFQHLLEKARRKLHYADGTRVTIKDAVHGCVVEDDDDLQDLPPDTTLMILRDREIWTPQNSDDFMVGGK